MSKRAVHTAVGLIVYSNEIQEFKDIYNFCISHKLKVHCINALDLFQIC